MKLIVESLPEEASDVGLEEEAIATSVRSRLRAARIYSSTAEPYLYVNVNIVGPAFGIGIYYNKILFDAASGEYNYAKTWQSASTGTHGRNSNYVLSSVSQHTDRFVDEYLRVNEKACTR